MILLSETSLLKNKLVFFFLPFAVPQLKPINAHYWCLCYGLTRCAGTWSAGEGLGVQLCAGWELGSGKSSRTPLLCCSLSQLEQSP